jgi:EmrB/QacA subfamily drug resistance transporter
VKNTKGSGKWLILSVVIIATFMSTLDSSIVNVALPTMAEQLGVTSSKIQLVSTSYLIAISGMVLIFGKLGDLYGKKRMFQIGLGIFTLGSLFCGISGSFSLLILSRIIQAIGAAGTMANNQGIITEIFPANERGKALGLNATAVALGSLVGPGLGGFIVGSASWEFIFLINIPIGLITLFFSIKLLAKLDKAGKRKGSLDIAGSILFILTIIPLFTALNEGLELGFTNPVILIGFLFAILAFIAFLTIEKRKENPLLQLSIFRNRLFSLSIFCGFISYLAIFCNNMMLPFYLQKVMTFTPQYTGFILMIYPMVLTVVAPFSGYLSDKIGSEVLTFLGLGLVGSGLLFMGTLNEASPVRILILYILFMSIGMGLFQSPNNSLIMSTVSKDKLGIAGSINALVRNIGMTCGIVLSTTLLYGRMSAKLGYRATDYIPGQNSAFIYGMRSVYITAAIICYIGTALTLVRLLSKKQQRI